MTVFLFCGISSYTGLHSKQPTMADVQVNQSKGTRGRRSLSIDLTPMVDLGFILITFFIYTTSIAEPRMMDINMPYKPATESTAYVDTATITIIPTKNHLYATYTGTYRDCMQFNTYTAAELRSVILDKKICTNKTTCYIQRAGSPIARSHQAK